MQWKIDSVRRTHLLEECPVTLWTVGLVIFLTIPGEFEYLFFEKLRREMLAILVDPLIK